MLVSKTIVYLHRKTSSGKLGEVTTTLSDSLQVQRTTGTGRRSQSPGEPVPP